MSNNNFNSYITPSGKTTGAVEENIRMSVSDASKGNEEIQELSKIASRFVDAMAVGNMVSAKISDGAFINSALKLGAADAKSSAASYTPTLLTFNRMEITTTYMGSWIFRRMIDKPAQDMWSSGITINSQALPKQIEGVYKRLNKLRSELIFATTQGRLYGGAASLIMIDDGENDLTNPINLKRITKGARISFLTLDRWYGLETSNEKVTDFKSIDFNTPKYYTFYTDSGEIKVHHSRVLRFVNRRPPMVVAQMLQGWGISEIEHIYQELLNHDNTANSTASLVSKALLEIVKLQGMRGAMSGLSGGNTQAQQMFSAQMSALTQFRTTNNLIFMDKEDEYNQLQYSFGGLSDILSEQKDLIAGAAEMPKVLLFGDTKGGLTSDSPAEMEFYASNILGKQDDMLRPVLDKLLPILFRAEGLEIPPDLDYEFESIAGMPLEKKQNVLASTVNTSISLLDAGCITRDTVLKEIQQVQKVTGYGSNIDEDDFQLAKQLTQEEKENPPEAETIEPEEEEYLKEHQDDYEDVKEQILTTHIKDKKKKGLFK